MRERADLACLAGVLEKLLVVCQRADGASGAGGRLAGAQAAGVLRHRRVALERGLHALRGGEAGGGGDAGGEGGDRRPPPA